MRGLRFLAAMLIVTWSGGAVSSQSLADIARMARLGVVAHVGAPVRRSVASTPQEPCAARRSRCSVRCRMTRH
mgnify:CR=1 FL=1